MLRDILTSSLWEIMSLQCKLDILLLLRTRTLTKQNIFIETREHDDLTSFTVRLQIALACGIQRELGQ